MIDYELLNQTIADSGLKKGFIATALGVTQHSLRRKCNPGGTWNTTEVAIFQKTLGLSDSKILDIFFAHAFGETPPESHG